MNKWSGVNQKQRLAYEKEGFDKRFGDYFERVFYQSDKISHLEIESYVGRRYLSIKNQYIQKYFLMNNILEMRALTVNSEDNVKEYPILFHEFIFNDSGNSASSIEVISLEEKEYSMQELNRINSIVESNKW